MKITILCSSTSHPINGFLLLWMKENMECNDIELVRTPSELTYGEILFLISCDSIITSEIRGKYVKTLVIHASDLPRGRGWSPHVWAVLNGDRQIAVTLLEAEDEVDSGDIWKKEYIDIPRHATFDEINEKLFHAEIRLMNYAVREFYSVIPTPQDSHVEPTYFRRRFPSDSEIDPDKTISEQFDLIRICDPDRFPAFFRLNGMSYKLTIEKIEKD